MIQADQWPDAPLSPSKSSTMEVSQILPNLYVGCCPTTLEEIETWEEAVRHVQEWRPCVPVMRVLRGVTEKGKRTP